MKNSFFKKLVTTAILVIGLTLVAAAAGLVIWGQAPAQPMPEALAALQPDSQVTITTDKWLAFAPAASEPITGFIFYPGGGVDYRAYAPAARQIASQGYLVVIVPMPLNLAVLNPNAAQIVIDAHPQISNWVVGGHSLGGAMAANFASSHLGEVTGLVLWGSYPAASDNLSTSELSVVSIYGTLDGLSTNAKIDDSRQLLPVNTSWVSIEGGNHAQFGWYGNQSGDNSAAISREQQQNQTIAATLALLEKFE